jgi:hypothetical protein
MVLGPDNLFCVNNPAFNKTSNYPKRLSKINIKFQKPGLAVLLWKLRYPYTHIDPLKYFGGQL